MTQLIPISPPIRIFLDFLVSTPGRVGLGDEVAGPDQPARHARPRASPPLPDRLALIQAYAGPVCVNGDTQPATTFLGDLEIFEQMLHNRLFGLPSIEPTVFHRAGS